MRRASFRSSLRVGEKGLLMLLFLFPLTLFAQEVKPALPDSIARADSVVQSQIAKTLGDSIVSVPEKTVQKVAGTASKLPELSPKKGKDSKMALLWSIIPGGGQIYNESYWKIPIVIGAYTACTYAITWNNAALNEYQNAYRDIMSDKPMENTSWFDFLPPGASPESYITNSSFQEQLRRGRDFYRRFRDMSIIVTVGVYLLVALDAYVDAELSTFDISPDLSLQASPAVITPGKNASLPTAQSAGIGVSLAFSF